MDEGKVCPSCGRQAYPETSTNICRFCGRILADEICLKVQSETWIEVRYFTFKDKEGNDHKVVALQNADRVVHFGDGKEAFLTNKRRLNFGQN